MALGQHCFFVVVVFVLFSSATATPSREEKKGGGCVRRWSLLLMGRAILFPFLPILVSWAFTYGTGFCYGSYPFAKTSFYC